MRNLSQLKTRIGHAEKAACPRQPRPHFPTTAERRESLRVVLRKCFATSPMEMISLFVVGTLERRADLSPRQAIDRLGMLFSGQPDGESIMGAAHAWLAETEATL
jgi:hypothetical protein